MVPRDSARHMNWDCISNLPMPRLKKAMKKAASHAKAMKKAMKKAASHAMKKTDDVEKDS